MAPSATPKRKHVPIEPMISARGSPFAMNLAFTPQEGRGKKATPSSDNSRADLDPLGGNPLTPRSEPHAFKRSGQQAEPFLAEDSDLALPGTYPQTPKQGYKDPLRDEQAEAKAHAAYAGRIEEAARNQIKFDRTTQRWVEKISRKIEDESEVDQEAVQYALHIANTREQKLRKARADGTVPVPRSLFRKFFGLPATDKNPPTTITTPTSQLATTTPPATTINPSEPSASIAGTSGSQADSASVTGLGIFTSSSPLNTDNTFEMAENTRAPTWHTQRRRAISDPEEHYGTWYSVDSSDDDDGHSDSEYSVDATETPAVVAEALSERAMVPQHAPDTNRASDLQAQLDRALSNLDERSSTSPLQAPGESLESLANIILGTSGASLASRSTSSAAPSAMPAPLFSPTLSMTIAESTTDTENVTPVPDRAPAMMTPSSCHQADIGNMRNTTRTVQVNAAGSPLTAHAGPATSLNSAGPAIVPEIYYRLRERIGLPQLRARDPAERKHPRHEHAWDSTNVMCSSRHIRATEGTVTIIPTDATCATCDTACCRFADLYRIACRYVAPGEANTVVDKAREDLDYLMRHYPHGVEDYDVLLDCSRPDCQNSFCSSHGSMCSHRNPITGHLCHSLMCDWCVQSLLDCDVHP